jgi:hypothetical protein
MMVSPFGAQEKFTCWIFWEREQNRKGLNSSGTEKLAPNVLREARGWLGRLTKIGRNIT